MLNLQLYIEGTEVELFKDESVSLTQTLQNVKDISKIFTDFTKTFNVPASKENNKLFKHFYNFDVTGYVSGTKKTSELYLNHQFFKKGKIRLEGVSLKQGKAHTYRLTFIGDTVNLKDLLGESKLSALDNIYGMEFTYNSDNVVTYMQDGLDVTVNGVSYPDALIVPLITHSQRLYYDSSLPVAQSGNLAYDAGTIQGVKYEQLKPAIRIYALIKAIEDKYGMKFSGDFFNKNNPTFYNLYLWLHRKEGGILDEDKIRAKTTLCCVTGSSDDRSTWDGRFTSESFFFRQPSNPDNVKLRYHIKVITQAQNYNVIIEKDGEEYERLDNVSGEQILGSGSKDAAYPSGTYRIYFESESAAEFQLEITLNEWVKKFLGSDNKTIGLQGRAKIETVSDFNAALQLPDMKILEFITGLFKMFNLTAFQDRNGIIQVKPLDDFYAQSKNSFDITKFLDTNASTVDALMPYRRISFGYEGTESFFSESHKELFNVEWGTENYEDIYNTEGETFELKLPFEHHKFERLRDNDGTPTNAQWGWSVDIKQETYLGEPLIFYAKKITSGTQIGVVKTSANRVGITDYYIPSNSVDITDSQNINFKAEFNEYAGTVFESTLFETYYSNYIGDTFDQKRRLSKFKAYLPLRILLNLSLADRIIIFDKIYKINEITTNLATGLSDLELINEVSDFVIENQDKYFADTVDKRFLTVDSTNVTVDWEGTV